MKSSLQALIAGLIVTGISPLALHADSIVIEGDLETQPAGSANGDVTVANELTVNQDGSVTAPAIKAAFKVEDNGVVWAGGASQYDNTNKVPWGLGKILVWMPEKGSLVAGYSGMNEVEFHYDNIGVGAVSFGGVGVASGSYSFNWGFGNAMSNFSTAWGDTWVGGNYATGWGKYSDVYGEAATAWGSAWAYDAYATAWGQGEAYLPYSTAWGGGLVGGYYGTSWGDSLAIGDYSTAWGYGESTANGYGSTVWGNDNYAESDYSTVFGFYAVGVPASTTQYDGLESVLEIGNGYGGGPTMRSNAVLVLKNGQTTLRNRYWDSDYPLETPYDPGLETSEDEASAGEALVVEGHARFAGAVVLDHAQGDILMGDYGN